MKKRGNRKENGRGLRRAAVLLWLVSLILIVMQLRMGTVPQWPLLTMWSLFGLGVLTLSIPALKRFGAPRWWTRRRDRLHSLEARIAFEQRLLHALRARKKQFIYKIPPTASKQDQDSRWKDARSGKRK